MRALLVVMLVVHVGCGVTAPAADANYVWSLPPGLPTPRLPVDNPMSADKVELGR